MTEQPERMETMSAAIDRLRSEGFEYDFSVHSADALELGHGDGAAEKIEDLTVVQTVRFEGVSNPDDEAMIMAIESTAGLRGIFIVPYGPDLSGDEADVVRKLSIRRKS